MHDLALPSEALEKSQHIEGYESQRLAAWCRSFSGGSVRHATIQLGVTAFSFAALMSVMLIGPLSAVWWLKALLVLPAAGFLLRLFIIQHDCGHGSFFPARAANEWVGRIISVLTLTPYDAWRRAHNIHHAGSGNLDRRGVGAIDTITLREYRALPRLQRFSYRLYRHPVVMLLIGMPLHIILIQRIPFFTLAPFYQSYQEVPPAKIWRSIVTLDVAVLLFYGALTALFGWQAMLTVFLPVLILTSWIGGWLFFVQHQFEDAYWQPEGEWEFRTAALHGSSYYVLPRFLQWITGNIGLHHIHHLCSTIPNYRLQDCMDGEAKLQQLNRMTILDSIRCVGFSLWDEDAQKMVGFGALKKA